MVAWPDFPTSAYCTRSKETFKSLRLLTRVEQIDIGLIEINVNAETIHLGRIGDAVTITMAERRATTGANSRGSKQPREQPAAGLSRYYERETRLRRRIRIPDWSNYHLKTRRDTIKGMINPSFREVSVMDATVDAPLQWVESISMLRLPEQADRRLQELMDANTEGKLTRQEKADLAALAELSERLSLVRAEALHLLGRKP